MVTWEQIQKANEAIKTTTISRTDKKSGQTINKEYAEVNQRIKAFRMVYPEGTIATEMLSNENGVCIFKASVYSKGDPTISCLLGTGTAFEKSTSSFINQTSYIENCETSAVGRALGMCGFGIDTSVASAEEVQNAMANQEEKKATPKQVEILKKTYTGENLEKLLKANKVEKLEDIPMQTASSIIEKLGGKK